uniref:global nitrogen transcriptional regulator n=1 Tax=Lithothamnion corallioides TaxID=1277934 RepID=UPI0023F312CE|nr:global nitrogen transcriptional regulator [Lithothamnion corallioides]WEA76994.1 global nitrogen transcriptional regulator [Lithothamnion corallioides]
MIWLEYLENVNISFNIEILQPNDSMIITNFLQDTQVVIILDGFVQLLKIFTNGETICTQLLKANHIIQLNNSKSKLINYHYKANAITRTALISIPLKEFTKKISRTQRSIEKFKQLYKNDNANHDIMTDILCHRNTKKRIIQLLLILAKEFGQRRQTNIIIPFYLSHSTLSTITGSNRVNITRIMNKLKSKNIISYDNQQLIIYNILKLSQS